jgi:hypothetical protein
LHFYSTCFWQEAVKQIELQLSSPRFLRQLDSNTVKLWPEDKIQCGYTRRSRAR